MKLELPELVSVPMGEGDIEALNRLHARCADYVELITGAPPHGREGEELYWRLAPGLPPETKVLLGLYPRAGGDLVGVVELIRDLRRRGDWCLALLVMEPGWRGKGLGTRLVEAMFAALRDEDGDTVCLVVQRQNEGALRFWTRMGFVTFRESVGELRMERAL